MKVLWVCNLPIPKIAVAMGLEPENIGGWLTGFANSLKKEEEIHLYICFPIVGGRSLTQGLVDNINYYGFPIAKRFGFLPFADELKIPTSLETYLKRIIFDVNPDILHIFGTEYPHALIATKVFNQPSHTVVNIQGLTSICAKHYYAGLPNNVLKKIVISNLVRGNLIQQRKRLEIRGLFEVETIQRVEHIIGRSDWDRACTKQVNPNVHYHFCNESLRDEFYKYKWDIHNCERHSIFMSQSSAPYKGLHFVLDAMSEIIKWYPSTHLYISGNNPINSEGLYNKLKISSYGKYISEIISKFRLQDHVSFLGNLNEIQMCERYLKSHIFVSASSIENSPNSLGEAMLLGVPVVTSDVGGIRDMIEHKKEGYTYQHDAPYMLANYICEIFSNDELANSFSKNAKDRAQKTHNRVKNINILINIYNEIIKE